MNLAVLKWGARKTYCALKSPKNHVLQPIDIISLSFIFVAFSRLLLKTSLLWILLKFLVKKVAIMFGQ